MRVIINKTRKEVRIIIGDEVDGVIFPIGTTNIGGT
jgi:hypothetical protein